MRTILFLLVFFFLPLGIHAQTDESSSTESLSANKKDGKYGYVDEDGNVKIPYQFKSAGRFHSGFAAVSNEESKYGFIDSKGKVVVPFQYEYASSMNDGLPETPGKGVAIVRLHENFGLINEQGKILFPFELDGSNIYLIIGFTEGLYRCKKDGKWGYITPEGKVAIPFQYSGCDKFHDGKAMVEQDGKYFWIDHTGEEVKK